MELIVEPSGILKGEKPSKVHTGILLTIVAYFESGGPKELSIFSQLLHDELILERDAKFSEVKSAKAVLVLPKRKKEIRQTKMRLKRKRADLFITALH